MCSLEEYPPGQYTRIWDLRTLLLAVAQQEQLESKKQVSLILLLPTSC